MTKVTIEGFPSRVEVIDILDNFLTSKGELRSYSLNNADNIIEIILRDYVSFS